LEPKETWDFGDNDSETSSDMVIRTLERLLPKDCPLDSHFAYKTVTPHCEG